jgi:ribosomal protein uL24
MHEAGREKKTKNVQNTAKIIGKTGKINEVDTKKMKIGIEGIQASKKDGTKVNLLFNPSNIVIQELNLEDKRRIEALNRSKKEEKK